jgi:hypothetical protein
MSEIISSALYILNIISSTVPDRKMLLLCLINALICEKASSIGLRSGEYSRKYLMCTPGVCYVSTYNPMYGLNKLTEVVSKL